MADERTKLEQSKAAAEEAEVNPAVLIPGKRKAAIAALALGPELSRELFKVLPGPEIERLLRAAEALDDVTADEVKATLAELTESVDLRVTGVSGHERTLKATARDALGDRLDEIVGERRPTGSAQLDELAERDAKSFARVLGREHPQVVAVVLAMLEPSAGASVMRELPDDLRADVTYRIAHLEAAPSDVLQEIADVMARELQSDGTSAVPVKGEDAAVGILKAVGQDEESGIFERLEERDREFAETLRAKMFTFEDIQTLQPREIQLILREVDSQRLALALKGASGEVKAALLENLSSRAKMMVLDEIEILGSVSRTAVDNARREIVTVVMELAAEEKVNIRPGDSV